MSSLWRMGQLMLQNVHKIAKQVFLEYSMLFVLFGLCIFFAIATLETQIPTGQPAADQLAPIIREAIQKDGKIVLIAGLSTDDKDFIDAIDKQPGIPENRMTRIIGESPRRVRQKLEGMVARGDIPAGIICTRSISHWSLLQNRDKIFNGLGNIPLLLPRERTTSNFLKPANLKNVAGQSAVFAIIAIGMTLVIITGGIDLSVGSLVALSAVTCAMTIRDLCGGVGADWGGILIGVAAAVLVCAIVGFLSGIMVTGFGMPPFIVTLATMSIARGLAQILAEGQSVYQVPVDFSWLAVGKPIGIPNEVIAMIVLYIGAHVLMTKTTLGRWFYAVGSNREAARLSGVPVALVLMIAYVASGALAGVGGVLEASRLQSGSPLYGGMYELYVITAVVVGGTSLSGGDGKILGTLYGALAIAVIRNGMNLMNIESYTQGVVMGVLILVAVFIDSLKRGHVVLWLRRLFIRPT